MVEIYIYRKQSRLYGTLCTFVVLGVLFLFVFLYIIHTPNPPYPESGGGGEGNGIELNLGFSDVGMGNTPEEAVINEENIAPVAEEDNTEENLLTQDNEDAPVIKETPKIKKEVKKEIKKEKTVKPKVEKTTEKTSDKPQTKQYTGPTYKPQKSGGDGTSNTPGDQGSPDGDLGAKAFGKGGQGGSGGGSGGGIGTGTGTGVGSGISFTLEGRIYQTLPIPKYKSEEEGIVVVEIIVDKEGNVTKAVPGVKGSTTMDNYLLDAAKQAALQAKFNRKPDAPAYQKGTIKYRFRLQ